jgi:hypothetical protein
MTFVALLKFENTFRFEVSDNPKILQLELTELQYDSILRSNFNQEVLISFYTSLPVLRFSELRNLI